MATRSWAATTPAKLRVLSVALVLLSLAWGAFAGWTVSQHSSAASDVVNTEQPLTVAAQQMYQSISDADVTATTTFLSGAEPPLSPLQQYRRDIATAAADLTTLKSAASGNPQLTAAIGKFSASLPLYTSYVAQAQSDNALGYPLTGGSFMQVASEEAHLVLLPAAKTISDLQDAALTSASDQATSLPPLIVAGVLALITAFVLLRTQRWLSRRTHRVFNYGLLTASAALVVSVVWLAATFAVARSDLSQGITYGSRPAGTLAQASIDVQQVRGDQVLNLISRSGDTSFKDNYQQVRALIGPGPGTLLDTAASSSRGPAVGKINAAQGHAASWYAANDQVYNLDLASAYARETALVTDDASPAAAGFKQLESDINNAINDDLAAFRANASAGANAFGPLEGVVIVASLLMAVTCFLGLARRIREYQ
jgi:hypothetical protein